MNTKALAIAAVAFSLAGGVVHADDRQPLKVRTSDLDLSSGKDVLRLYYRLYEAAEVVCGGGPLVFFAVVTPPEYLTCRDATLDASLGQFDAPLVQSVRQNLRAMGKLPRQ
jgi:UrcA family protein